jgi:hypothetical protein
MTGTPDAVASEKSNGVPEAESPIARSDEQEVASGRTASTPVALLANLALGIGLLVLVALTLAVLAYLFG